MGALPKLKEPGLVGAQGRNAGDPDTALTDLTVTYRNDLSFWQAKFRTVREALCITPKNKNVLYDGLHLTAEAARQLVTEITTLTAAPSVQVVEITNHRAGQSQVWARLASADAEQLAHRITSALTRAGVAD